MTILSLKGTLLYWLEQFLMSECEKQESSFTNFSHNSNCSPPIPYKVSQNSAANAPVKRHIAWHDIPLKHHNADLAVLYTSALPQLLATGANSERILQDKKSIDDVPIRLSRFQLTNKNNQGNYLDNDLGFLSEICSEFQIRTQRLGWLTFQLSNQGIANWLRQIQLQSMTKDKNHTFVINKPTLSTDELSSQTSLLQRLFVDTFMNAPVIKITSVTRSQKQFDAVSNNDKPDEVHRWLWQSQYTYARCRSLLRYWPHAANANWLDAKNQLHFQQLEDWRLLQSLVATVDAMFWIPYRCPTNQYFLLLKSSSQLCQAFDAFYRTRLAGFAPALADLSEPLQLQTQARFGLVLVTQRILKTLLEQYLEAIAPESL